MITSKYELIAGERRLKAMKLLGYKQVDVRFMEVQDAEHALNIEISENETRKDFSKAERIDYGWRLKRIESVKAKERQGTRNDLTSEKSFTKVNRTTDIVASKLGIGSGKQFEKEEYIVENKNALSSADFDDWDKNKLTTNKAYNKIKQKKIHEKPQTKKCLKYKQEKPVSDFTKNNDFCNEGTQNTNVPVAEGTDTSYIDTSTEVGKIIMDLKTPKIIDERTMVKTRINSVKSIIEEMIDSADDSFFGSDGIADKMTQKDKDDAISYMNQLSGALLKLKNKIEKIEIKGETIAWPSTDDKNFSKDECGKDKSQQLISENECLKIENAHLRDALDNRQKQIDKLMSEKSLLERKVKLNQEDSDRYKKLQHDIEFLTQEKSNMSRQIDSATELSGLTVSVQDMLEKELAPIKFKRCMDVLNTSEVAVKNLEEVVNHVQNWVDEMKTYLPNNNSVNIIDADYVLCHN